MDFSFRALVVLSENFALSSYHNFFSTSAVVAVLCLLTTLSVTTSGYCQYILLLTFADCQIAIARIHRAFEHKQTSALLVSTVHDEIIIECPLDEIEQIQHIITDCMVKAGQQFLAPIPVLVETKTI